MAFKFEEEIKGYLNNGAQVIKVGEKTQSHIQSKIKFYMI